MTKQIIFERLLELASYLPRYLTDDLTRDFEAHQDLTECFIKIKLAIITQTSEISFYKRRCKELSIENDELRQISLDSRRKERD
jgi:hypothetical protein